MPFWPFRRQPRYPYQVNPSPTQDLELRAMSATNAKRWKDAERLYRELVSKGGKETRQWARNMLGQALEKQGREDEAILVYEQNVAEGTDAWGAHQRLAVIYRRLGRKEDERRVLLAALQSVSSERGHQWCRDRLKKMK
jgi:hypothetical protein